jgi:hypothetical protein
MSDDHQTAAEAQTNPWCNVRRHDLDQHQYVERVLEGYRQTRTTDGKVRSADRWLAIQLYRQGVPVALVEAAFALAAVRRLFRPPERPPLAPIHSLSYFIPVMEEIRECAIDPGYIQAQQWKLENLHRYAEWIRIPPDKPNRPPGWPSSA